MPDLSSLTFAARETVWSTTIASYLPESACEVRTAYGARCDIVTSLYAIEVERASKWAESIGQSLFYAAALGREPAVILLVADMKRDQIAVGRCAVACAAAGITFTWMDCQKPEECIEHLINVFE